MKLVSIIMTCHNGSKYLKEALNSILNQTYQNWELIFYNNFSTDDSKKIISSIYDNRIKYFETDNLYNLGTIRSKAILEATGDFITFLDVDDIWDNKKIELQVKKFLSNNSIDLVYSNLYKIINNKNFSVKNKLYRGLCGKEIIQSYILANPLTAWVTLMIKKEILNNLEYTFDHNLHIASDFDLILRLSKFCNFDYVEEYTSFYRVHSNNESKNIKTEINELYYIIKKYEKDKLLNRYLSFKFFNLKIKIKKMLYKFNFI